MNAVSREHLVFRSPSNSNPQTGGPFLPLHRLSRRAATESSPSAFLVHADRAGNLIPSSGMIHRIQRVFTPDPVSGLALPGHHISSTEGMSGSLQRMSTSQNTAGAGTIETGPASLRTFPETSGNQPDMAQIASRVYDLLVVRLQNERQRRGF
jgi:hypothetical protein